MTILYNKKYVDTLTKRDRKNCFILSIVASACILEGIISCFLVESCDVKMVSNLTKGTFILGGWICIYYIFALILPNKRKLRHMCMLLRMEFQELQGDVVKIDSEHTVSKDIIAKKLTIKNDGEESVAYWNVDFGSPPFVEGQHIKLCVSNRFVISYMTEGMEDVS